MGNFEQILRIALYHVGAYFLGDAIASGAEYQAAIGGIISVGTFAWWAYRNRKASAE